jgi:hypothetical protein
MAAPLENGLYHIILTLDEDVTNYVATIRDGIIEGGDRVSCFSGTIRFDANRFHADLITRKYAELDGYLPVFGTGPIRVTAQGTLTSAESATGTAVSARRPGVVAQVEMRRLRVARAEESPSRAAA